MEITPQFWQNKKVFLTGHTGFKGSWMTLLLESLGSKVYGFALAPNTQPNLFELAQISKISHSKIGDIRNRETLTEAFKEANPDIVIHMAAQPLVRYSYSNPVETYETNVMGTLNLLEAIRTVPSNVKSVVIITTDKCYENKEWIWSYRENEALGGYDPYSSSKACTELLTQSYRNSFLKSKNIHIATTRAGNVIGGGDWSLDRLVPDIIRSSENKQILNIRSPQALRPWQHVLEPLSGYLMLAERLYIDGDKYAEAWNFGPYEQDVKSVEWIANHLLELFNTADLLKINPDPNQPHEATLLKLDSSKAIRRLGWQPKWTIRKSLEKIYEWHLAHRQEQNMREICLSQIKDFAVSKPSI